MSTRGTWIGKLLISRMMDVQQSNEAKQIAMRFRQAMEAHKMSAMAVSNTIMINLVNYGFERYECFGLGLG